MILTLSIVGFILSLIPALMFIANLPLFCVMDRGGDRSASDHRDAADNAASELESGVANLSTSSPGEKPLPHSASDHALARSAPFHTEPPSVSVLVPARDEQASIARSIESILQSQNVNVEVIVLDDHSTDDTAAVVDAMARRDHRVRLVAGKPLPDGWNGKQHACFQLAQFASYQRLMFLDADVRLATDGLARLIEYQDRNKVALLSAFPHQETGTWLEKWIIPLMHYILLGFLPLPRMRQSTHPSYASGCGQCFLTMQSDYMAAGTHQSIRGSRHDGLKLPRAFRIAGLSTDVVDGTSIATCRMYTNAAEVVRGVLKNAIEGIANPRLIGVFSILLLGGSVLPWITLAFAIAQRNSWAIALSVMAVTAGHAPRAIAAKRFRQPLLGVVCHGPAVALFVALQWIALANHLMGRQIAWRGRTET
ncbi:4,4'-diaponeurosporenoate glycosyltransferase [Rubripirellula lacrimiformis]|uniref:4,4'-diaponeurosporenoate glycosyltransferase n=1 Tax=Rubripirellula lacrimiformis TaxID=1930273 RepID=A0A517NBX0_9BACT|nr:glycosyltransferase family A protein [Rubripirellula lacrimiformis]QDT04632.1 4,4'-diaponeurosporenoate glycosyltransferase [Rubripirellula lacrimiformis]